MGLKWRAGRPYYYRSRRRGDRVATDYGGAGSWALALAGADEAGRAAAGAAAAERRALAGEAARAAWRARAVRLLTGAALGHLGYYRHRRGAWRRSGRGATMATGELATTRPAGAIPSPLPPREEVLDVLTRCAAGDAAAVRQLGRLIDRCPGPMILCALGDLTELARTYAIKWSAGADGPGRQLALERKLELMTAELAGPAPTPAVRLLAERVALAWLDVHTWDIRHYHTLNAPDGIAAPTDRFFQRARDLAQRRYLAAVKALVQVQALTRTTRVRVERHESLTIEETGPVG